MFLSNVLGFGGARSPGGINDDADNDSKVENNATRISWVYEKMRKQRAEFCTVDSSVSIFAGTWNVAGKDSTDVSLELLREWLLPLPDERCDIYAIAFQEICELNALNVVVSGVMAAERAAGWKEKVAALFRAAQLSYSALYCHHLVGTALVVFVRSELLPRVRAVRGGVVATGAGGLLGNKGAVAVRFKVDTTSLCFLSAHLSADRCATALPAFLPLLV